MTKELQTTTLLYSEYVVCTKYPSKYFIVNSLQQYVFVHTRSRVAAEEWRKTNYPLYSLRTQKRRVVEVRVAVTQALHAKVRLSI